MQFLIIGKDGADAQALERRMATRAAHLAYSGENLANLIIGVATLNEAGQMNGSTFIVDFPDRAALDAWLAKEPYVVQGVWQEVTVTPCKVGPSFVNRAA